MKQVAFPKRRLANPSNLTTCVKLSKRPFNRGRLILAKNQQHYSTANMYKHPSNKAEICNKKNNKNNKKTMSYLVITPKVIKSHTRKSQYYLICK